MKKTKKNKNSKIILRKLNLKSDISKQYCDWMNDHDVHQYTEQNYIKHSLKDIRNFLKKKKMNLKMSFYMEYF